MADSSASRLRAEQALHQSSVPALRQLRVSESDGEIILTGRVTSYYLKQLAQAIVLPLIAECRLSNRITVGHEGND